MHEVQGAAHGGASLEWALMGTTTISMVLMSLFAIKLYKNGPEGGQKLANSFGRVYALVLDKWRIDELYQFSVIEPLKCLGDVFFKWGDRAAIEGVINDGPKGIYLITSVLSDLQTGLVRNSLKLMFLSVVIICASLILF